MDVVLILLESHTDDGNVDFLVDTLLLQAVLQDVACGVSEVMRHLYCLGNRFDGLCVDHLLGGVDMAHHEAEEPEEEEQDEQTEEHDAHSQQGDAKSVGVVALQFGVLCLVRLDKVLNARGDVLCLLDRPIRAVLACKRLVGSQRGHGDGVDEVGGITVVECYP